MHDDDITESFGAVLEVTLASLNGYVTVPEAAKLGVRFMDDTQDGSSLVRFRATEQNANRALEGLVWQADLNWYGAAWLNVTVNDLGFSGFGGPQNDTQSIPIFVRPVNDAPVLNVPLGVQSVAEDHKVHLPCGIFDADADVVGFHRDILHRTMSTYASDPTFGKYFDMMREGFAPSVVAEQMKIDGLNPGVGYENLAGDSRGDYGEIPNTGSCI